MERQNRNSNFEFLRIIMMLLIVFHHSIVHGVGGSTPATQLITFGLGTKPIPFPHFFWTHNFICSCFAMFGKMAVDVFVMISGFFLVKSHFNYKKMFSKILRLVAQVYFYSLLIFLIAAHWHWLPINTYDVLAAIFPFFYNTYWFAIDYLLLYLVYPYINILINSLTQKQHFNLILTLILSFTVVPVFVPSIVTKHTIELFILFVMLYIIGGYIKLYPIKNASFDKKLGLCIFAFTIIIAVSVEFITNYIGGRTGNQAIFGNSFNIVDQYSFLILIMAVSLMYWVKNWRPHTSKTINFISATTFGVYLIHDNPIIEIVLWNNWLHMPTLFTEPALHLILVVLVVCPIIFIVCSLIDSLRLIIFNFVQRFFMVKSNWRIQNNVK